MEQRFGFFNPRILQRAATLRRAFVRGVCPLAGLMLAAVLASACRPDAAAFSYAATPVDGWQPTDTLRFPVDSLREEGSYSLTLGVRTSTSVPYPYRSLTLRVSQHWQCPDTVLCDTVCVPLTDEQGNPAGRGITLYQLEQPFARHSFRTGQRGEIRISHLMRAGLLQGIESVGVRVERE